MFLQKKIAFLSEDHKKVGLMLDESIETNCIMTSLVWHMVNLQREYGIRMQDKKSQSESHGRDD